jgi:Flp pilus assembly pilin Flp
VHARGQGLVEYALILVVIMVVCVGILTLIGQSVSGVWYQSVVNSPAW